MSKTLWCALIRNQDMDNLCSLIFIQTFTATAIPEDGEYVMAEYKGEAGKVPSTYIEYI